MIEKVKNISGRDVGVFAGGVVAGAAVLAVIGAKGAAKAGTVVTAGALRAKDAVMSTVERVQAEAGDIVADAKAMNEKHYQEKDKKAEAEVKTESEIRGKAEEAQAEEVQFE